MMSRNNKATRHSTTCDIIGPPSDLPSAELPTLKQVLQKCLKTKQSSSHYNLPANQIAFDVSKDLIKLWQKVHPDIPLHQPNSIRIKVKASYEEYTLVKRNKLKLKHFIEQKKLQRSSLGIKSVCTSSSMQLEMENQTQTLPI